MSPEVSEKSFEEAIECALLEHGPDACAGYATAVRETPAPWGDTPPGGYRRRRPDEYDRALCLLPRDVLDFARQEARSEEHTSELQSRLHLLSRLLLEKKTLGGLSEEKKYLLSQHTK